MIDHRRDKMVNVGPLSDHARSRKKEKENKEYYYFVGQVRKVGGRKK
jgi:hypothetical protein